MDAAAPILAIRGLTVSHGKRLLLSCPRFDIDSGDRISLVGASGAGKSLLCQAVLGHLQRTAPSLSVAGSIVWAEAGDRERPLVGYVPQGTSSHLHPAYRVGEQVVQLLNAATCNRRDAATDFVELLVALRFKNPQRVLDQYPHQLSGGMRQRILLALAIATRPDLLVLDEPTSALDGINGAAALGLILREVETRNIGLIYVTHRVDEASLIATLTATIRNGNVESPKSPDGIFKNFARYVEHIPTKPRSIGELVHTGPIEASIRKDVRRPAIIADVHALSVDVPNGERRRSILANCTFQVLEGQRLGVVGESGSGKTTLLRCMAGLLEPSNGDVRIADDSLLALPAARLRALRRSFQLVTQDPRENLNPFATVRQLFSEPARIHGYLPPNDENVAGMLDQLGLARSVEFQSVERLSFGQRQRVAIGRAIIGFPGLRLLMLDEPLSGLDAESKARIIALLRETGRNTSLVIASHDLASLEDLCDSLLILREGEIVEQVENSPWTFSSPYGRLYRDIAAMHGPEDLRALERKLSLTESQPVGQ